MSDVRVNTSAGWKDLAGTTDGRAKVTSAITVLETRRPIAAAGNYDAEDVLSNSATDGQGTAWALTGCGNLGVIYEAQVAIQTTALTPRITLYLFNKPPTSEKDDGAANVAPSLADLPFYIGRIDVPSLEDLGGVSAGIATPSTSGNLPLWYWGCDNQIYAITVTRDAITGETANDMMMVRLVVEKY